MAEPQQPLILHIHIFKNAGTSIERILRQHFGERWRAFDRDDPAGVVTIEDVAEMRRQDPSMAALSTHQFSPPLRDVVPGGVYPILVLRNPLARLRSVYEFDRQRGPVTPAAEIAAANDFATYVDEMIRLNHPAVVNAQVGQLSGARRMRATGHRVPRVEELLDLAWEFVDSMPTVGLVESFAESGRRWERDITQFDPDFRFFEARENVTQGGVDDVAAHNRAIRAELGDRRAMAFNMANSPDWKLYHRAAHKMGQTALAIAIPDRDTPGPA